ncbi:MAG: MBL fold metallo-hydrolase [bacterium]
MARALDVILLGTGAAFPPADRENTSLVLEWEDGLWLIDAGASPERRMRRAGLDPSRLRGILLTHTHPDHLYGLPSLIHCLVPKPRGEPLPILGLSSVLKTARALLETFDLAERPEVPLRWVTVPEDSIRGGTPVWREGDLRLWTEAVAHSRPCIGVRAQCGEASMAYTSDTEPCEGVDRLAQGVDLLVHEATCRESARSEMHEGHSTAEDAGRAAERARAGTLLLVHFLEETIQDPPALMEEAGKVYLGRILVGEELERYRV